MLPPHIINELFRRERERDRRRSTDDQPRLELPLPPPSAPRRAEDELERDRGVTIIDLFD